MAAEKMSPAQVDIVLPCHEGDAYAEEALRSLLVQTHESWKAWIVDDGSSEQSRQKLMEIVARFADPRINVITQRQQGAAAARNKGVEMGEAPWVAFLDIDDLWVPDKLERQLTLASSREGFAAVYSDYLILCDGRVSPSTVPPRLSGLIGPALVREGNRVSGSASAVLVSRSALRKAGPFDESLRLGEDWDMWIRIALLGEFTYVDQPLVHVRQRSGSVQEAHRLGATYAEKTHDLLAHVRIVERHAPMILPEGQGDPVVLDRLRKEARRLAKRRLTWPEVGRLKAELLAGGDVGKATSGALATMNLLPCLPWILARTLKADCAPGRLGYNP